MRIAFVGLEAMRLPTALRVMSSTMLEHSLERESRLAIQQGLDDTHHSAIAIVAEALAGIHPDAKEAT